MNGVAYSYLRFSTPEQAFGDSRRRQLALAEAYARQHDLLLDKGLNFRDLGMSAFRGKNAKEGGLRSFLDAVEHGLVPPNSFLLVESLDRLSRDKVLEAQALFLQIITAGVTIVTLLDQRAYSIKGVNANPTDLIISLVYMMRANEESATKSFRLRSPGPRAGMRPGTASTAGSARAGWCPGRTRAATRWSRRKLLKVVVDWEQDRLVLHWRYGGTTYEGFWHRRQKGTVRNRTLDHLPKRGRWWASACGLTGRPVPVPVPAEPDVS